MTRLVDLVTELDAARAAVEAAERVEADAHTALTLARRRTDVARNAWHEALRRYDVERRHAEL